MTHFGLSTHQNKVCCHCRDRCLLPFPTLWISFQTFVRNIGRKVPDWATIQMSCMLSLEKMKVLIFIGCSCVRFQKMNMKIIYRICANRTPLLIRIPGCPFWVHCGYFVESLAKNSLIFDEFLLKMTIVHGQKLLYFNGTPVFYLRRYNNKDAKSIFRLIIFNQ